MFLRFERRSEAGGSFCKHENETFLNRKLDTPKLHKFGGNFVILSMFLVRGKHTSDRRKEISNVPEKMVDSRDQQTMT